jgi:hypothetical protein
MQKFKIVSVVLIASFLFIFLTPKIFAAIITSDNDNFILTLKPDKASYAVGDKISLTYTIFNNGTDAIYVYLGGGGLYSGDYVVCYDSDNRRMQYLPILIFPGDALASKDGFILLDPQKSYSITFKGEIKSAEFSNFNRKDEKKLKGIFIDFGDSVIFLDKIGNFNLTAFYNGSKVSRKKEKIVNNLGKVLTGNFESEGITISVK